MLVMMVAPLPSWNIKLNFFQGVDAEQLVHGRGVILIVILLILIPILLIVIITTPPYRPHTQSIIHISLPNHLHVFIKSLRPPSTALLDINSRVTLPYGIKYTSAFFSPFQIGSSVTDIGTKCVMCKDACNNVTVTISLIQVHGEWVLVICCTILQVRSFHIWYLFRPVPNKIRFESFFGGNVTMIQWVWSPGAMTGNYFFSQIVGDFEDATLYILWEWIWYM